MDSILIMAMIAVWLLIIGGIILLYPVSRRLGHLLEAMAREKREGHDHVELERVREALESLEDRMALMEERQEFTERLLESRTDPERRVRGGP